MGRPDEGGFDYNIFLIGFMGSGKSTVAGGLSEMFGLEQVEMDELIVSRQQMPITQIFEQYGEAYFRELESQVLIEFQQKKRLVVSCGGGVVMRPENTEHMKKNGRVVWLLASPETVYERVKDSRERPLLNDHMNVEYIAGLMEKRRERYQAAADFSIRTDGKSVQEICQEIADRLREFDEKKA